MKRIRRRHQPPPTDVLDPFPGDVLTQRVILCAQLREWADDFDRQGSDPRLGYAAVAFYAGATSVLRQTADEIATGTFDPAGTRWTTATTDVPLRLPYANTETRAK